MKRLCIILLSLEIFIFENCLSKEEQVVMCNYDFSTVQTNNSGIALSTKPKKAKCDKEVLIKGLSHMGVANPEDVAILPSSTTDVDELCSRIEEALKKMIPVSISCAIDDEVAYFRTLLVGLLALHSMLCDDPTFRADYRKWERCLHKLYWEFEDCEGPTLWICNTNETLVCDTYRKIQTCVFLRAGVLCGWTGASIMNVAVRQATDNMLNKKCKNVHCEPQIPKDIVFAEFAASPVYVADQHILFGVLVSSVYCFFNHI